MKVLHVIPSIADKDGGPSQAIFPMCAALLEQGIDAVLATTDAGLSQSSELPRGELINYKGVPAIIFLKRAGKSFKYSRQFSVWLDDHVVDFDLVHIHAVFNHSCIAAARACRKHAVPYLVRPLGTLDPWSMQQKSFRKKMFWRFGIKRMLEGAAALHYTSVAEQEAVESSLNLKRGFVAPLGVDGGVRSHETPAKPFKRVGSHPYVLFLSRLHPKKELETLIEAFLAAVKTRGLSEWRLVIAGDGEPEYVSRLKDTAGANSPNSVLLFTGWLQGEEKELALRNAALLALISRQENFGLCVAEAMARSVPVLVSPQVNLSADIELSGAGWVTPINKERLATTLAEVMSNDTQRNVRGAAGRELAAQRFSWQVIGRQLAGVYASIMSEAFTLDGVSRGTNTARHTTA